MAKYLVPWRRKTEALPNEAEELKKAVDIIISSVASRREGTIQDWEVSLNDMQEYGIIQDDCLELQEELMPLDQQYIEISDI